MNASLNSRSTAAPLRPAAAVAICLLWSCGGSGGGTPPDGGMPADGGGTPVWVGVIGTGQSLSVGAASNGLVFTKPSPNSFKLSLGARETTWPIDATDPELSLVPLAEPIRTINTTSYSAPYPINIYGETFHTTMAVQLDTINRLVEGGGGGGGGGVGLPSVHSVVGQGDSSITVIQKGGTGNAYAASLFEAAALTRLAAAAGARYEVFAVVLTHGEKDAELPSYEDGIARLQSDYEQDLKAITGQTRPIPLILTQQHADPVTGRSTSTVAAWKAGVDHPGKIYCAGPKYQYAYANDHIHLLAGQYDRLGVKYLLDEDCSAERVETFVADFVAGIDVLYLTIDLDVLPASVAPGCRATFRQADLLRDGDLPEGAFDAIVCFSVLAHIANADGAARGLARALAPGGTLVTGYPMVSALMTRAFSLIGFQGIDAHHVTAPVRIAAALARVLTPRARAAFPPAAPVAAALYQCTAWTK